MMHNDMVEILGISSVVPMTILLYNGYIDPRVPGSTRGREEGVTHMEYRRFDDTYVVRLDVGDEIGESILKLAEQENITLAEVSGLGAVNELIVSVFDSRAQRYITNPFRGAYEITSMSGNITMKDGKPHLHMHIAAGDIRGNAVGGHLVQAFIAVTGEVFVRVLPGTVERRYDENSGINVLHFADE